MISNINFKNTSLIIPREEARDLGIVYVEVERLGKQDDKIQDMGTTSYKHYKKDLEKRKDGYYLEDKKIESYYRYDFVENDLDYVKISEGPHLVDLMIFAPKCNHEFTVLKSVSPKIPTVENIQSLMHELETKTNALKKVIDSVDGDFNQRCNVHVGGGLMTTFNDLMLKEDTCTDELQAELNNGWRLLACCVQPNQRRPDYILGRYNPALDTYSKRDADR